MNKSKKDQENREYGSIKKKTKKLNEWVTNKQNLEWIKKWMNERNK